MSWQRQLLRIVVLLLIIGAILVVVGTVLSAPSCGDLFGHTKTKRLKDQNNLSSMMDRYISGNAMGKERPSSTGYRFWISLFVGDGPDGDFQVTEDGEGYLSLADADLLVSPFDDDALRGEDLRAALQALIDSGQGAAGATPLMCSYAGPRGMGERHLPRNALHTRRNWSGIVGVSGGRDGTAYVPNGIVTVDQHGMTQYWSAEDLEQAHEIYSARGFTGMRIGEGMLAWVAFEDERPEPADEDEKDDEFEDE